MTAYQLAVSNKNEAAIKMLIQYEQINKHSTYINTERLSEAYVFPDQ
jgi:hypothetical protein